VMSGWFLWGIYSKGSVGLGLVVRGYIVKYSCGVFFFCGEWGHGLVFWGVGFLVFVGLG